MAEVGEYVSLPKRIQRKRTKGWRMPSDTVYVGRGSLWGNPWTVTAELEADGVVAMYEEALLGGFLWLETGVLITEKSVRDNLRGRDLACWCEPGAPCHADVLLEVANRD